MVTRVMVEVLTRSSFLINFSTVETRLPPAASATSQNLVKRGWSPFGRPLGTALALIPC